VTLGCEAKGPVIFKEAFLHNLSSIEAMAIGIGRGGWSGGARGVREYEGKFFDICDDPVYSGGNGGDQKLGLSG